LRWRTNVVDFHEVEIAALSPPRRQSRSNGTVPLDFLLRAARASDALLLELRLACLIGHFLADGGQLLADLEHAGLDPASRLD